MQHLLEGFELVGGTRCHIRRTSHRGRESNLRRIEGMARQERMVTEATIGCRRRLCTDRIPGERVRREDTVGRNAGIG